MPNGNPEMMEFSMETAASWVVPRWPAKIWVVVMRPYWQKEVKMAGPARCHSFLDSMKNSPAKWATPLMGWISSSSLVRSGFGVNRESVWSRSESWPPERSCAPPWSAMVFALLVVVQWMESFDIFILDDTVTPYVGWLLRVPYGAQIMWNINSIKWAFEMLHPVFNIEWFWIVGGVK